MKKRIAILVVVLLSVFTLSASAESWLKAKGSFQTVFNSNLDDISGFGMSRARVGIMGSIMKNTFFEVVFEGKYTEDGRGVQLKKGYLGLNLMPNMVLEAGALMISFTKPISGTEFAFINYDVTRSPDSYQYGLNLRGTFLNKMLYYYFSVSNGEGLTTENVGNGLLYTGRLEFNLAGNHDLTEGCPDPKSGMTAIFSVAAALDNKNDTDDQGVSFYSYNGYYYLVDATIKLGGIYLYGQANYNIYQKKPNGLYWGGAEGNAKRAMGGFVQAGYNLKSILGISLEPMVKYEFWRETINEGYGDEDIDITNLAVALNWYSKGHYLKAGLEYRKQLSNGWENPWMLRKPDKNFFGVRLTYKFTSK